MTRFLVTGASGLLGLNFSLQVAGRHEVVGVVNRHGLEGVPFPVISADLTQSGAIERLLEVTQPEVVINCAAIAILDTCEAQPELAAAWSGCMRAFEADAHLDEVFGESLFWVVTRSIHCFY